MRPVPATSSGRRSCVRTPLRELEAQQLVDPLRGESGGGESGAPKCDRRAGRLPTCQHGQRAGYGQCRVERGERAAFMTKHLWVTPYADRERFAAGDFPYQHPGGAGLRVDGSRPAYRETDVVLWYTVGPPCAAS